jgi:protein-tyrosine phosphatase
MSVQFDPSRVSQIHSTLWRGNFPIKGREVDFDGLAAIIKPTAGLVEVCLTDNTGELDLLEILERTYGAKFTRVSPPFQSVDWNPATIYQKESDSHFVVWWPIEGGTTPDVTGPNSQSYNFVGLINFLKSFVENDSRSIYVHCMNGTDRTGAVAAGYAIRAMNMNLEEAMSFADSVKSAGTMSTPYRNLVEWYSKLATVVNFT